jgi:predicted nucleic acid-binding protein
VTGFLIDTNVVSELRKGDKANPGVRDWFAAAPAHDLYLSVLVVGELRRGIELIRKRDPVSAQHLEAWFRRILKEFADHVLPVTKEVAELWGGLSLDRPLPPIDGLIAATAMYHDMTLITRNKHDVERAPVRVLNPFV